MTLRRARIVIADHQVLFRRALAQQLTGGGHVIISEASDGAALDQGMIDVEPDVVFVDRFLPGIDALGYTRMLHALQPQTHVVLLTGYESDALSIQAAAFLAGASGCLSKELDGLGYLSAVRRLMEGQILFLPEVMRRAALPQASAGRVARLHALTDREREILRLVAEGMGNQEIADRAGISSNTVMKHVSNILSKLQVSNRREAGILYARHGDGAPFGDA
jgi:DNA-binding NarL/FixJ family response regulator